MKFPKPDVLSQIAKFRAAVIEAHAGTGKTFTIEHLVVDLVLSGLPMQELLVVTYTDKAARELKERVRAIIERILYSGEAARSPGASEPCWDIGEAERNLLRHALFTFELAQISTIHGFCQRLLKETAFLNKGRLARTLVSARDAFDRAFHQVFRDTLSVRSELRELLSFWLREAGETVESLRLVLREAAFSGAGSERGPVPVELPRCASVPWMDLAKKLEGLADFLRTHAVQLKGAKSKKLRNVLAFGFIEQSQVSGARTGFDGWAQALREARIPESELELLRFLLAMSRGFAKAARELDETHLSEARGNDLGDEVEDWLCFLRDGLPTLQEWLTARLLPEVRRRVAELKNSEGQFDFDDLLHDVADALANDDQGLFCNAVRARYRVAIIDEFQDTDPTQWFIFRTVFFASDNHRLLLVGDPKQAIYSFRGADVSTYLQACQEVRGSPDAPSDPFIRLDKNFRSSEEIIEGYNAIFSSAGSFFQGAGIDYRFPVSCGHGPLMSVEDPSGRRLSQVVRLLEVTGPEGKSLDLATFRRTVMEGVAREILTLIPRVGSAHRVVSKSGGRELSYGDVFVLVRTNTEASAVASVLRSFGIPSTLFQTESVFSTEEAEEIDALLDAVLDFGNVGLMARVFLTRFFGLTLADLNGASEGNFPEFAVEKLRRWHLASLETNAPALLSQVFEESGVLLRELGAQGSERSLTNFLHLTDVISRWQASTRATLRDIHLRLKRARTLMDSEDAEEVQRLETDSQAVQILTMHKCKGLEAAVVFLCGGFGSSTFGNWSLVEGERDGRRVRVLMEKGHPRAATAVKMQERAEDERLLYVALTRPTHLLYLPYYSASVLPPKGGVYDGLVERLRALVDKGGIATASDRDIFAKVSKCSQISAGASLELDSPTVDNAPLPLDSPPFELEIPAQVASTLDEMRRTHRAPGTTSYSRLSHGHSNENADKLDEPAPPTVSGDEPRGAAFGICFHSCMEHLDTQLPVLRADAESWGGDPAVRTRLHNELFKSGVAFRHLDFLTRLVFQAAHFPLITDSSGATVSFVDVKNEAREWEFCFPWPEEFHGCEDAGWRVERGFVVGACDLVFRHDSRLWVADWKTDLLPEPEETSAQSRVEVTYRLQVLIYTLAIARLAGVTSEAEYEQRVGGYVYLFVRKPVAVSGRVKWSELQEFENRLRGARGMTWEGLHHG